MVSLQKNHLHGLKRNARTLNMLFRCMTRTFTSFRNTKWVWIYGSLYKCMQIKMYTKFCKLCLPPLLSGHNKNSSRMCGILLHVEKVRALWLLCAAESVREEKVQQLSWSNVSEMKRSVCLYCFASIKWKKVHIIWKKQTQWHFFVSSDLMDRLVDEAEGLAVDSSSSVCSGAGGGGRLETTTEQQLSLLNSITASDLTG